jgi:hypothetical protein
MGSGGFRAGAGRPAGSKGPYKERKPKGKHTKMQVEKVLNAVSSSPDKTPLAFLLAWMQDQAFDRDGNRIELKFSQRMEAAIAAAPYVHAKLASIELKGDPAAPLQVQSDIGQALKQLAEMARSRLADNGELKTIDLEPSTLPEPDTGAD